MTSFVDDNGNYLDYGGEDFLITKQSASILDLKIKGDVSVNFDLDNTSVNRNRLGYFGPMQVSSPVLSKIAFNLMRNGNFISKGYIVVQRVNDNKLSCYFIAGNSTWFDAFQFNIQELDLNAYTKNWNYTDMVATKSSTSGIIFPLIDAAYQGQKFAPFVMTDAMVTKITDSGATEYTDQFTDLYPCFYLHTLMEEVSNYSQYKFSGDLLNDAQYKSTIITPAGGALTVSDIFIKQREAFARFNSSYTASDPFAIIIPFPEVYDGSHNLYTPSKWAADGNYTIEITVRLTLSVSQAYTVYIYKNGSLLTSSNFTGTTVVYTSLQLISLKGDYYEIYLGTASGLGSLYDVLAGSSVLYTVKSQIIPQFSIIPNTIIPSIKAIELVKSVAIRFGCVVTFDNVTKTISLNKIDNITATENWSDYLVSYEYLYDYGFENNYILTEDSPEFDNYNLTNPEGYGGANILTPFTINKDKELYTDPFPAVQDLINVSGHGMLQPVIPLVTCEDDAPFVVTGVTSAGGFARFTVTGFKTNQNNTIIRSTCPAYLGFHQINACTATAITTFTPYTGNDTGTIWTQSVSFNETSNRLLTCLPDYNINKIGPQSSIDVYSGALGHVSHTTWPFAYFCKPTTGKDIDQIKPSLSYGPINAMGYNDETVIDNSYKAVSNMLSGPIVRCKMLLPESVFGNFNYDKKIELKCKDFSGYFWINKPSAYKDSKTLVEVDFLFM